MRIVSSVPTSGCLRNGSTASVELGWIRRVAVDAPDRLRFTTCMADTIFGKIVRGEIPCHKVYEDAHVLAFLDINPLSPGHTLIIPKEPAETLDQLSDDAAAAIGRVLPRLSRAVLKATGAEAYNVLQNNGSAAHQTVFHVHFHIIPKFGETQGLGIRWPAGKLEADTAGKLAREIKAVLG